MRVIYNGVDLGVLETYAFDWEPVYDDSGVDYLFTRVSLVVRCMINGQAEVLNAVPGRPFNGPPISYAFDKLQSPPTTETQTSGGDTFDVDIKNKGTTATLRNNRGGSVIDTATGTGGGIAGGAAGFNQDRADAAFIEAGFNPTGIKPPKLFGGAVVGGGKGPGGAIGGVPRAVAIPGARLPNRDVPVEAFRPLPAPVVTQRNNANARIADMNIAGGTGTDAADRSPLRRIVRVANAAPLTHTAIRHRLGTPRGKLYVFSGPGQESGRPAPGGNDPPDPPAQLVVQSPQNPKWATDCKNGPTPKILGIHTALGDMNTLLVDWQCETFVNEVDLNEVSVWGALLSNRFSQTQSVKDDGYSVIGTAGTALFRSDFVYDLPESPDLKRPILFMPVPQGFVRRIEYVTGRADSVGVDYAYVDTQVSSNFVAGVYVGAASISAVHRQAITSGDVLGGALSTYERVLNLMALKHWSKGSKDDAPRPVFLVPPPK